MSNPTASSLNFRSWVCDWGRLTNEADDLYFSLRVSNISRYLLESKGHTKKWFKGYLADLVNKLSGMLAGTTLEKQLLTHCRPSTIKKLKIAILHKDRVEFEKCLERLNKCFSSRRYLRRIQATILDSLKVDDEIHAIQLLEASRCLISTLLTVYPIESLVELPKRIISKSYFRHYQGGINERVKGDQVILEEISKIIVPSLSIMQDKLCQLQSKDELKAFEDIFVDYHIGFWEKILTF